MDDPNRRALLLRGGLLTGGAAVTASIGDADGGSQPGANGTGAMRLSAPSDPQTDSSAVLRAAFKRYSDDRTSPPGLKGWGIGAITTARGIWTHRLPVTFADSQVGFALRGDATYATTHLFHIATGGALQLKTYVAVVISDLYLRNTAPAVGDSVGISLDPVGGGGPLTLKRVAIDGFATAIKLDGSNNGDKTLVEQVSFATEVGFDNGRDKQAVGWSFLNCSGQCGTTHFRCGGAGEITIGGYVGNVFGSFIELPEGAGNAGSGNFPARVTVTGTQLEYHGAGPRMLMNASGSRELTDGGGTNADIVLREVSLVSGATPPDPRQHVIVQVGDDRVGSDAVRIKQEGGWIEGIVRHGSQQQGALNRRWSFRDAVRAPDPRTVELRGTGNHPLMEWRANENVPVDQYRGGQGFTGAIDAQKAFLWRHIGAALLNTGAGTRPIDGRHGADLEIGGFPAGATQMALAVFLDEPLKTGVDLEVRQFSDGNFREPIADALVLRGGAGKGLHRVHDHWHVLGAGALHVRMTLPGPGLIARGALVVFYFPYMGS